MTMKSFALAALLLLLLSPASLRAATYTYDELDRLIAVEYPSGETISYNYDAAGNLTSATPSGAATPVVSDAPRIARVEAGNQQATVWFTPGPFNGGSAVSGYTVTASPGNLTAKGATSPLTIYGLSNFSDYTLTVTAQNASGSSASSAPSATVTPVGIGYALTLSIAGSGSGTVAITPGTTSCGNTGCTSTIAADTLITLTPQADSTSDFAGWSGACSGTGVCQVVMTGAKSVTASFSLDTTPPSLSLSGCPAPLNNLLAPEFILQSAESRATFLCALDGAAAAPCANPFAPAALADGLHTLGVRAVDPAGNSSVTQTCTWSRDTVAPVLVLGSVPARQNNLTHGDLEFSSGDAGVNFTCRIDGAAYAPCTSPYHYAGLSDGEHSFSVLASDAAGNETAAAHNWAIDATPPQIVLSGLSDYSYSRQATLNFAGTVSDASTPELTINTIPIVLDNGAFSQSLQLQEGENVVSVVATDGFGNRTQLSRTIVFDPTAPLVTIALPADNSITASSPTVISGTVDEVATVEVTLNGGAAQPAEVIGLGFSSTLPLVKGLNTIEVVVSDLAGNMSSAKRTVTLDPDAPSLALTSPPEDQRTNRPSQQVQGSVVETLTSLAEVSCRVDSGTPQVVLVTNNIFSFPVDLSEERTYAVTCTATDSAGNIATVVRNITYDVTDPAFRIDAVSSPTRHVDLTLTGTREIGTSLVATSDDTTVGAVSYPSEDTWAVTVHEEGEGTRTLSLSFTDSAGNAVSTTRTLVFDHSPPQIVSFTLQSAARGVTVPVTLFSGNDNLGIAGYLLTESALEPSIDNPAWAIDAPQSYSFTSSGTKNLYAWVKDAAGNLSLAAMAVTEVNLPSGDVDGNGQVDIADALFALKAAVGAYELDPDGAVRADVAPLVNGFPLSDGNIDVGDAIIILKKVVGLVSW